MDPATAFGVATNVFTIIDLTWTVGRRIKDYIDATKNIPDSLREAIISLPLLLITLENIRALDLHKRREVTNVLVVIDDKLKVVDQAMQKIMPLKADGGFRRLKKAGYSFKYQKRIDEALQIITDYKNRLSCYIASSNAGELQLIKLSVQKRGKLFNYELTETSTESDYRRWSGVFSPMERVCFTQNYRNITESLFSGKQRIFGNSIVVVDCDIRDLNDLGPTPEEHGIWDYSPNTVIRRIISVKTELVTKLASDVRLAGLAQVIIYLDLFERQPSLKIGPSTIKQYLRYLEMPASNSSEEGWDVLKANLERWQRPFLLLIDIRATRPLFDEERALIQHVASTLPQKNCGSVVFLAGGDSYCEALRPMQRIGFDLDEATEKAPLWQRLLWIYVFRISKAVLLGLLILVGCLCAFPILGVAVLWDRLQNASINREGQWRRLNLLFAPLALFDQKHGRRVLGFIWATMSVLAGFTY